MSIQWISLGVSESDEPLKYDAREGIVKDKKIARRANVVNHTISSNVWGLNEKATLNQAGNVGLQGKIAFK